MKLAEIMENLQKNAAFWAAFYTALLALLSMFLSVQEYYRRKAFYDYFRVEENFRPGMRSGFHPQYLTFAALNIVLMTLACTVLFGVIGIQNKENIIIRGVILGGIAVVALVSFVICCAIYLVGQKSRTGGTSWKSFLKESACYGRWKALQWGVSAALVFLAYYPAKWWSWVFVPTLVLGAVLAFYLGEYFVVRAMIPHYIHQFMSLKKDGTLYILLCSEQVYYCVRAEQEDEQLNIFPNEVLLLKKEEEDRSFQRISFASFKIE